MKYIHIFTLFFIITRIYSVYYLSSHICMITFDLTNVPLNNEIDSIHMMSLCHYSQDHMSAIYISAYISLSNNFSTYILTHGENAEHNASTS